MVDEILCAISLFPRARTNLKAPLRQCISVTVASEKGCSAVEVIIFVRHLFGELGESISVAKSAENERAGRLRDSPSAVFCGVCTCPCHLVARCGPGCDLVVCSVACFRVHRSRSCLRILDARYQLGVVAIGRDPSWVWSVLSNNVDVSEVQCGACSLDMPPVVIVHLALPSAFFRRRVRDCVGVDIRVYRQQVGELVHV